MTGLDAIELAGRLQGEQQDFWLHLEAGTPLDKYPAKQHARRVVEKLGVSNGLIYLAGAVARNNEDSDMPAPFRQRRYFYYLSGCNEANCHVTYDIQNDKLTLFIPRINPARVIWNGRGSTPAEALNNYDIDAVYYEDESKEFVGKWLNHYKGKLYILQPAQSPLPPSTREVDSTSLRAAMNLARVIKDEHEIKLIKKANDISSQAHKEVLANISRFKNEAEVEGLFLNVCISQQAKQQAYDPIAASGPNAGTLHYDSNNQDFEDRQLMCLDAGCEFQLYASDITRTFPLSGNWPSEESRNIYRLVERMQEACIAGLAPGVRFLDLHILAHHIAIDGLLSLGIFHNGTREEIYKAGTSRAFFPHGLGHHVGLEVHDVGHEDLISAVSDLNPECQKASSIYPKNFHVPVYDAELCLSPLHPESGGLQEGMIVTVEPGIYFSTYALNMFYLISPIHSKYINVSVLKNYLQVGGVRIEDDILITSKGYENLTTAPKGDAMLEIIRNQKSGSKSRKVTNYDVAAGKESNEKQEAPLMRAPGVPKHMSDPIPRSIERAATLPVRTEQRRSVELEPFEGPSLFSNFKRASTIDQLASRKTHPSLPTGLQNRPSAFAPEPTPRTPLCEDASTAFNHKYLDAESLYGYTGPKTEYKPMLPSCPTCDLMAHLIVERAILGEKQRHQRQLQNAQSHSFSPTSPEMTEARCSARRNDSSGISQPYVNPAETARESRQNLAHVQNTLYSGYQSSFDALYTGSDGRRTNPAETAKATSPETQLLRAQCPNLWPHITEAELRSLVTMAQNLRDQQPTECAVTEAAKRMPDLLQATKDSSKSGLISPWAEAVGPAVQSSLRKNVADRFPLSNGNRTAEQSRALRMDELSQVVKDMQESKVNRDGTTFSHHPTHYKENLSGNAPFAYGVNGFAPRGTDYSQISNYPGSIDGAQRFRQPPVESTRPDRLARVELPINHNPLVPGQQAMDTVNNLPLHHIPYQDTW